MTGTAPWARVFAALVVAILPPILLLVATLLFGDLLAAVGPIGVAVVVVLGALLWAGLLSVVFARALDDDIRGIVALAERGAHDPEGDLSPAHEHLARVLDDRNRQVTTLAARISEIPIDDEPRGVISKIVAAVRSVTGDATWRCAVLAVDEADLLPAGSYATGEEKGELVPIGDLEQWVSGAAEPSAVRRVEGPWGAFLLVNLSVTGRMRAVLYAPWEGRPEPTVAETALLSLVGQHATIALQHALLYRRVHRQADELNRLAAVQSDFLRAVTHDLQTPLTSIRNVAAEFAAEGDLGQRQRQDVETIVHQAERLQRMVAQLLSASRIEAGVERPQADVFAAQPVIERAWAGLRADRPLELTSAGQPHLVIADQDRFEQVLWAILDNAVKYSPPGSPIAVMIDASDGEQIVSISDRGAGMDAATRDHAFDQFYRGAHARAMAPNGSGIGLYTARGLMRAMNGDIAVESSLGGGTTIRLRLPAERAEAD